MLPFRSKVLIVRNLVGHFNAGYCEKVGLQGEKLKM